MMPYPFLFPVEAVGHCLPLRGDDLADGGVDESRVMPNEFCPGSLHVFGGGIFGRAPPTASGAVPGTAGVGVCL